MPAPRRSTVRQSRPLHLGVPVLLAVVLGFAAAAEEPSAAAAASRPSLFRDPEDGAVDLSGWLASRTGVLPIPVPITEPAVGYGGALGLVHFSGGGLAGALKAPPRLPWK